MSGTHGATATHLVARLREPGSPTHAALLRVALAVYVLVDLRSASYPLLFAIGPSVHPQAHLLGGPGLYALFDPDVVRAMRDVGTVAAVAVLCGLGGRLSVATMLACFLVTQLHWFGATLFHDAWIYFTFPMLALASLSQPTAFSIDAVLFRGRLDPERRARESRFLVVSWVFFIGFVYGAAGIAKLFPLAKGIDWLSGRAAQEFAIEFVRQSPAVALLGHTIFPYDAREMFCLASVGTVAIELGALALWFSRRTYLPLAIGIFAMHFGIWLVGIPAFMPMFSVLALALLPRGAFARLDALADSTTTPNGASGR